MCKIMMLFSLSVLAVLARCRLGLRSAREPTQGLGIDARGVAQNSPRGPGIDIMGHTVSAGKGNIRGAWIHTVWLIFRSGADQLATRDI